MTSPRFDSTRNLFLNMVRLDPFSISFGSEMRFLCSPGTYSTTVKVTAPCIPEKLADPIESAVSLSPLATVTVTILMASTLTAVFHLVSSEFMLQSPLSTPDEMYSLQHYR